MALPARELRIGNLVYYRKEDYKVVLIAEDLIKIDIGYGAVQRFEKNPIISPNIDELKPIPLTEEWILKFGFKRQINVKWGDYILPDWSICYDIDTDTYFWYEWEQLQIKYVHQLQNLYFALTGNELKITKEDDKENNQSK